MAIQHGPNRSIYLDISEASGSGGNAPSEVALTGLNDLDVIYRALCALLYNFVPTSGHPGGSVSSSRIVAGLLFDVMDYDLAQPGRDDADIISYAAGHKAMGLYAMWALRDEIARQGSPSLLPPDATQRLRLEDLLGFRRNPTTATPLFRKFASKSLDGHPTPATPFVRLSTGASGVGLASSLGLALATRDYYGSMAPRVHIVEGEGGLTPGRSSEALAAAGTAGLSNAMVHLDWNQASIDSDRVCREEDAPGDYVQWTPGELFRLHDWNVVYVPDGSDPQQVRAGQHLALEIDNGQPTAVVYRTVKGHRYGIEGRASHGAGHALCSDGFCQALSGLTGLAGRELGVCPVDQKACMLTDQGEALREGCFWESLELVRAVVQDRGPMVEDLSGRLVAARDRLDARDRRPREGAPRVEAVFAAAANAGEIPAELALAPGTSTTLRGELGRCLRRLNEASEGALLVAAADLIGSTSINVAAKDFPAGFWHAAKNIASRQVAAGGICEDAIGGIMSGVSAFGHHIGAGSSYAAFMSPLGHISARLHAIGAQAERERTGMPYRPLILVCAHAGLKTGEDGPTHADPQPLQLLQGNFPPGTAITLTPWDPQEIWPLLTAALSKRPALIAPFVTRPKEGIVDRAALGLAPAEAAVTGVYTLRRPEGRSDGTLVLQGSDVAYAFVEEALPLLTADGIDLRVYYVASAELFDLLPAQQRAAIYPPGRGAAAMGITGFTLPTMYRWVQSDMGRAATLHPYRRGHYLGSGRGEMVLAEAGLDGESQYRAIRSYIDALARARRTARDGDGEETKEAAPA